MQNQNSHFRLRFLLISVLLIALQVSVIMKILRDVYNNNNSNNNSIFTIILGKLRLSMTDFYVLIGYFYKWPLPSLAEP